jgi:hypothetical protein
MSVEEVCSPMYVDSHIPIDLIVSHTLSLLMDSSPEAVPVAIKVG